MPLRLAVALVAFVVLGCGQSTATPSPAPTVLSTLAPTLQPTPAPTPAATPIPDPTATSGSGAGERPPACGDAVLEWDGERLLLATCVSQISGQSGEQIWAFSGAGWSLVSDDGPPPVVVTGAAWDPRRGVLVRYGGLPMDSNDCVPETWEWDGASWNQPPQIDTPDPAACDHMKLIYDPTSERVLLVGGGDDQGNLSEETWAWDGADWDRLADVGPVGRAHHGLVSDSGHGRVFLYGGYDGNQVFDDFWEWNGAEWSELPITGPGPRSHFGLAISDDAEMLLYGGATGPQSFDTMVADTWLLTDGRWRELTVEGPSARLSPALGFDQASGRYILYGGFGPGGEELGDTWEFDGTTWECVQVCEVEP